MQGFGCAQRNAWRSNWEKLSSAIQQNTIPGRGENGIPKYAFACLIVLPCDAIHSALSSYKRCRKMHRLGKIWTFLTYPGDPVEHLGGVLLEQIYDHVIRMKPCCEAGARYGRRNQGIRCTRAASRHGCDVASSTRDLAATCRKSLR